MGHIEPLEVTAWVEPARAAQAGRVLQAMSRQLRPIAVGGPRGKETDQLAARMGCPLVDDLRKLLVDHPARYLLIDYRPALAAEDIAAALTAGTTIITTEPLAAELDELAALAAQLGQRGAAGQAGRVHLLPQLPHTEGWRRAADPAEHLAKLLSMTATNVGPVEQRSLFARLMDLWLTALRIVELPEVVTATLAGASTPDSPRQLTGQITVHARCGDGSGLALSAGDRVGRDVLEARFTAAQAMFEVEDNRYVLTAIDGSVIDQYAARRKPGGVERMLADAWMHMLDQPGPIGPPWPALRDREALACCLACLLSTRTGQPESPARLMSMGVAG